MAKQQISLSPTAIEQINAILSNGNKTEITVKNGRLAIYEVPHGKKKYEVVVAPPR